MRGLTNFTSSGTILRKGFLGKGGIILRLLNPATGIGKRGIFPGP